METKNTEPILSFDWDEYIYNEVKYYKSEPEYATYDEESLYRMAEEGAKQSFNHIKDEINLWLDRKGSKYNHIFGLDGSLGLWNGPVGFFKMFIINDIEDLFHRFKDTLNIIVELYEDRIEVSNVHHDGTNYYTIYPFPSIDKDSILHILNENVSEYGWETIRNDYGDIEALKYEQLSQILYDFNIIETL